MGSGAMSCLLSLRDIAERDRAQVGEKGWNLARMARAEYPVPPTLILPVDSYHAFLQATRLDERIGMELGRKDFAEMRWEEIWDAALRIRNLFLTTPLPSDLTEELRSSVRSAFGEGPLVVRSSAPGEDTAESSFAGLHDSFVNVRGEQPLLEAVAKVWASLWSDRALLYRQELGLDLRRSAMAVLIQPMVTGDCSGVVFSRGPVDAEHVALEAVWGLNQGLVDGSIEPDRWEIDRQRLLTVSFHPAERSEAMLAAATGVRALPLEPAKRRAPPLAEAQVLRIARTALRLETLFAAPQDIEWTLDGDALVLLQARPVTARRRRNGADPRAWFLSLRRSFDNLRILRREVEERLMPAMEAEAEAMAAVEPAALPDGELAAEIARRRAALQRWEGAYREKCIPLAHGVRLFGEFYNDLVKPQDPFAFVDLLQGAGMRAVRRNRRLEEWAEILRQEGGAAIERPETILPELPSLAAEIDLSTGQLAQLLREMAHRPQRRPRATGAARLRGDFLAHFDGTERRQAEQMLELALASYRLRDDDNISLGKIRRQMAAAEAEGMRRGGMAEPKAATSAPGPERGGALPESTGRWHVRQVQGQPAGAGIVTANVRVVGSRDDLARFRAGEILVCDAIDPTMTFVVPLAAAIVERRGGMLIHGAIIAREYGLPCVTGVPDATLILHTGQRATVDGYLGLVTIEADSRDASGPQPALAAP